MNNTNFERNLPAVTEKQILSFIEQHFALTGKLKSLVSECDLCLRLTTNDNSQYIVRVSNAKEQLGLLDFQNLALSHLSEHDNSLPIPSVIESLSGNAIERLIVDENTQHFIRVITYLSGDVVDSIPAITHKCRENIGVVMGKVATALQNFNHPHATQNQHLWDLNTVLNLKADIDKLNNPTLEAQCYQVMEILENTTFPALKKTRWQVLHQDAHAGNVLVQNNDHEKVAGIIDFGDMTYGSVVSELVIAADNFRTGDDPVANLVAASRGFDQSFELTEQEVDVAFDLMLARIAQTVIIAGARDEGEDGHIHNAAVYEEMLAKALSIGRESAIRQLRKALSFPVPVFDDKQESSFNEQQHLLSKREQYLGKLWHFYQQPLRFVRGEGAWLYTADNKRYLDSYNNVPQVGHSNPQVVKAIARQAKALNTNTRYLCDIVGDYAERLLQGLPNHLNACVFVNSGSEANDFAGQIAKNITGNEGFIIVEDAYHGCTELSAALSPLAYAQKAWVETVCVPDSFRGEFANAENSAEKYADSAALAIKQLDDKNFGTAAYMIDTALCSNGVVSPPENYFNLVAEKVKQAGGLVIADEVQAGCGRMGRFWGFEQNGLSGQHIDIVTMGKPVANGHPLGVVILNREMLNDFQQSVDNIFSTFGGNTVACAAGMAVLDVIENGNLIEHGVKVGDYFKSKLKALSSQFPVIADVRGKGFMIGVEFLIGNDVNQPATKLTAALLEKMKENNVLCGSEGKDRNILKLRPSFAWQESDVDFFIDALSKSLSDLALAFKSQVLVKACSAS